MAFQLAITRALTTSKFHAFQGRNSRDLLNKMSVSRSDRSEAHAAEKESEVYVERSETTVPLEDPDAGKSEEERKRLVRSQHRECAEHS